MSTTTETLLDALKQAVDALQLCRSQLYHDGVMIDQSHPKRIAVTAAENCMVKIADILAAANAAPTEQAAPVLDAQRYQWVKARAYKDGATLSLDVAVIDDVAIGDYGSFIDDTIDAAIAAALHGKSE